MKGWREMRGEVKPGSGKEGMEQSVSAGKVSMLVSVPYPPVMMRPAIIELIRTVCLVTLLD